MLCRLNTLTTFGLLTLAAMSTPLLMRQETSQTQLPSGPPGWWVYPEREIEQLTDATISCFNHSRNEWKVTATKDGIQIVPYRGEREGLSALPKLPANLKLQPGMPGRNIRAGLSYVGRVGDTWLLAYDGGEWGGGLWLADRDGSKTKRVIADNVRAVIPTKKGFIVLSGLAHMVIDFGTAYVLSNPSGLSIQLERAVQLDGEPRGYSRGVDGSILFTTTSSLNRITEEGELTSLTALPRWVGAQYANSLAVASDQTIYVGMRMFVLKLESTQDGYKQTWLLPNNCKRFELKQSDCVCSAN